MALTLDTAARNAAADGVVDLIDGGDAAGRIEIYNTASATLLATLAFTDPAFAAATAGVAVAAAITDGTCVASGTAVLASIFPSTGNVIISGLTVGTSGSDLNFSNVTWATADVVGISTMTVTMPESA